MLDKHEVPGSNPGWPTKKRWRCEDARAVRADPGAATADAAPGSRTVAAAAGDHRRSTAVSELAATVASRDAASEASCDAASARNPRAPPSGDNADAGDVRPARHVAEPRAAAQTRELTDREYLDEERVAVCYFVDLFRRRLSGAVAGLGLDAKQHGRSPALRVLQRGGEFERVRREHAVVVVARRDQGRGIVLAHAHVVVRRVGEQRREVGCVVGRAVVRRT